MGLCRRPVRVYVFRLHNYPLDRRIEDGGFPWKMRLKAEAMFVERKNKDEPVLYEFVGYQSLYILFVYSHEG